MIATHVKSTRVESLNKAKCRIRPGAMPKLKKSANVSNSLPMREVELSARARRPSRPSRIMATTSAITAMSIRPSSAKRTDVKPTQTAPNVIKLGSSANGRTRPLACVRSRSSGSVTWQPQGEPAVGLSVPERFHPPRFSDPDKRLGPHLLEDKYRVGYQSESAQSDRRRLVPRLL